MNTIILENIFTQKKVKKPLSARNNSHKKLDQRPSKLHYDEIQTLQSTKLQLLSRSEASRQSIIRSFGSQQSLQTREKKVLSSQELRGTEDLLNFMNVHSSQKLKSQTNTNSQKVQSIITSCTQTTRSCNLKRIQETVTKKISKHKQFKKYQQLRTKHQKQHKLFQMVLNPKEMHRLQKIYETEEAKYLIKLLECIGHKD